MSQNPKIKQKKNKLLGAKIENTETLLLSSKNLPWCTRNWKHRDIFVRHKQNRISGNLFLEMPRPPWSDK
jgi:hypothetical protein